MIKLVLALHCHQPVGNFDKVFHKAFDQCYRPLLELLTAHPGVKAGLHFSGCLLEWLEEHRPEGLDLIAALTERGQVEMMSGGFYEPLLATIPRRDAHGQVMMLNDYLEKRFGPRPTGFWLTERIWDPSLPVTLEGTGLKYTVVDDTHFYYAGLEGDQVFGPYLTEREGRPLTLLATPMLMRYMIPFWQVDDVINRLREWEGQGRTVAVYGDDGEKFGLWPGTHEWVIQKGWLDRFFSAVEANGDWLGTATPGEYAASTPPLGRLYIPQASYEEMTEWALPPSRGQALEEMIETLKRENRWDAWRPFVRGGIWDNFLVKYEESNRMHKKMLRLSGQAADNPEALRLVWRAQCNCAYWHGVFGGLYMGHLRRAIHENLAAAQDVLIRERGGAVIETRDYDLDGSDEILVDAPHLALGLAPARGGTLFDLTLPAKRLNLADVLTRRPEAYHRLLPQAVVVQGEGGEAVSIHDAVKAKEPDLERFLAQDPYPRVCLVDHFFEAAHSPEDLAANRLGEIGDFAQAPYETASARTDGDLAMVDFRRQGWAGGIQIALSKKIKVGPGPALSVDWTFENQSGEGRPVVFACELNLNLFSDEDQGRYLLAPDSGRRRETYETGIEHEAGRLTLVNRGDDLDTHLIFSRPAAVSFFPLMTVSMSEDGFEKSYQGHSLYIQVPVDLGSGRPETFSLNIKLG